MRHELVSNRGISALSRSQQLTLLVLCAFVLRAIVVAFVFRGVSAPTVDHERFGWEMGWSARSLAMGRGFGSPFLPLTGPTALVPPLFPFLLSLVFRIFGIYSAASALVILLLNSLFSALTCLPIYAVANSLGGERVARFSGWAWVAYPFAIYFSADRVWDYSLTCLLFTTCLWAATRLRHSGRWRRWLGFGVLYGITALSNPSILVMFPILLVVAIVPRHRLRIAWIGPALVAVLGLVVVLTPWLVRNARVMHALIPVRDGFWLECEAGNDGNTFESNDHLVHPASSDVELQRFVAMGEIAYFDRAKRLTLAFIQQHPVLFVRYSLHRFVSYWTGYWSFNPAYRQAEPTQIPNMFLTMALTCFMLRGARRKWREDREKVLPYLLLLVLFPLPYYLSHVAPDYRQPIEPVILMLVVVGVLGIKREAELPQDQPSSESILMA